MKNYYDYRADNQRELRWLNLLLPIPMMLIIGIPILVFHRAFASWQAGLECFLVYFLIWYGLTLGFAYFKMREPLDSVTGKLAVKQVDDDSVLANVVEELAVGFAMKNPAVYIVRDAKEPNAFAISNNQQNMIVVTQPLLDLLTRSELSGVIGHELAHLKAKDSAIMMRFSLYVASIAAFYLFGYEVFWFGGEMFEGSLGSGKQQNLVGLFVLISLVVGLPCLVLGYVGKFLALILQFAVSRNREYDTDLVSAQINQNSAGLISALQKLRKWDHNQSKSKMVLKAEFAPLYFVDNESPADKFKNLFTVHPSISNRIRRLKNMQ